MTTISTTTLPLAAGTWTADPSHTTVGFVVRHLGLSKVRGRFDGVTAQLVVGDDLASSSVSAVIEMGTVKTGNADRDAHLASSDFFNAETNGTVKFASTAIEVTGETTAQITGDLTINGVTKAVVLEARLNQKGDHPMMNKPWVGFDATTTVLRSEFNLGMFAPYISDEVKIDISIEAMKAE